jgi:hypothetical protein
MNMDISLNLIQKKHSRGNNKMKKFDIVSAYCEIRTTNHSIPDEVLDFMYNAALEKYEEINAEKLKLDTYIESCKTISHQKNCFGITCIDCPFMSRCRVDVDFQEKFLIIAAEKYLARMNHDSCDSKTTNAIVRTDNETIVRYYSRDGILDED